MSHPSVLALFPGQGSQKVGMGKALVESSPVAREYFDIADRVLGFSLRALCFDGPEANLTRTEVAQPAILTISSICFALFAECGGASRVVAAAGHSLGEYSALVAAGALRFEDAVLLVHKRGRYMQEAVPVGAGKMVAVLGKEVADIEHALKAVTSGTAQIANINAPGQIVVAGDVAGVDAFCRELAGAKIMPLQVSAPFHCSLMKPAEVRLAEDLKSVPIATPRFPVIANVEAQPLRDPEQIREALRRQVCGRVRWVECVECGLTQFSPAKAVEFGQGATLAGLMKRIRADVPRANVDSMESAQVSD